jgi:hypothetical protein
LEDLVNVACVDVTWRSKQQWKLNIAHLTTGDMTREQMQSQYNNDYLFGKISVEEWREKFDELSNVRLWVKEGKVKEPKEEKKNG